MIRITEPEKFYYDQCSQDEFIKLYGFVQRSIDICLEEDKCLLESDSSEMSVAHRMAMYLEEQIKWDYPRFVVDIEHNKGYGGYNHRTKRVKNRPARLDIAAHMRDKDETGQYDNLIAIELKKESRARKYPEEVAKDKLRLDSLTDYGEGYAYRAAFMIFMNEKTIWITEAYSRNCRGQHVDYEIV